MVTAPRTKDPVTAKIDNVASRGIVCFPQKSSEIVLRQITQDRDSPCAVHPRYVSELIERKTRNVKPSNQHRPVPARTSGSVMACSPSERKALAMLASPHDDRLDCQEMSRLKVIATGVCHARSRRGLLRTTAD